jgi:hypothetical protein
MDNHLTLSQIQKINEEWPEVRECALRAQNDRIKWLYTAPGIGIAALVTLVAPGNHGWFLYLFLFFFSLSIVLVISYNWRISFCNRDVFYRFLARVQELETGVILAAKFKEIRVRLPYEDTLAEYLVVGSTGSLILGLVFLACAIMHGTHI